LIDLSGYTRGARPEILAFKPARIQVTYLGYPGTMGANFIDYIIADNIVIPPENENSFTEKVVFLPNSFMICDNTQAVPKLTTTREELGLAQESFVYCCFCQSYKITRHTFETWMRILDAVPHGLLWLQHNNEWADDQLRKQALNYGIDPERLVFAKKIADRTSYIAQYMAADLFLDTQIYNAHSTACEALWAGLPVLTCLGETYATRVGASLLSSVGLSELIAKNMSEYEDIAIKYAQRPDTLHNLQQRLITNRSSHPLFDTAQSVANLETAYTQIWSDLTHLNSYN